MLVGVMGLGRGRSRPPWRDASGEGDLWRLRQAVYMATISTWLGGVGGAAIPVPRRRAVGQLVAAWRRGGR
jgi:hypothetical protein